MHIWSLTFGCEPSKRCLELLKESRRGAGRPLADSTCRGAGGGWRGAGGDASGAGEADAEREDAAEAAAAAAALAEASQRVAMASATSALRRACWSSCLVWIQADSMEGGNSGKWKQDSQNISKWCGIVFFCADCRSTHGPAHPNNQGFISAWLWWPFLLRGGRTPGLAQPALFVFFLIVMPQLQQGPVSTNQNSQVFNLQIFWPKILHHSPPSTLPSHCGISWQ